MFCLSRNGLAVKRPVLACAALAMIGCSKQQPTPEPTRQARPPASGHVAADPESEAEARDLVRHYEGEGDQAARIELIYQLAINGAPEALRELGTIYRTTTDSELKEHSVRAQSYVAAKNLEASISLLTDALQSTRPETVRAVAMETLREIQKPETIPLWQTLVTDNDPSVQETARAALEFLTAEFPPK